MRTLIRRAVATAVCIVASLSAAWAAPIPGLFNTGVQSNGSPAPGGIKDLHYVLTVSADPTSSIAYVTTAIPSLWIANGPASQWIAPEAFQNFTGLGDYAGTFIYRTTFDLTGFDPTTAVISGQWATDNTGTNILLNGVSTGNSIPGNPPGEGFIVFWPFTISSGFAAGINTLDFVVYNAPNGGSPNPTGLRVEFLTATANQAGFSISLSGLNPVEPSGTNADQATTSEEISAQVKDQNGNPVPGVAVTLTTEAVAGSGGHAHDDGQRPKGVLSGSSGNGDAVTGTTDQSGQFTATFYSSPVSGAHLITATCGQCSSAATGNIDVMVGGFALLPGDPNYSSAPELSHPPGNHYLTPSAAAALGVLAFDYNNDAAAPVAPQPIVITGGSLEWGGVDDIFWSIGQSWQPPHVEHRRGTVVDVRANDNPGAIPASNFREFNQLCRAVGAQCAIHSRGSANQHFHVRLFGRPE